MSTLEDDMYEQCLALFAKNKGKRATVSFGNKDDKADGTVTQITAEYVVLGDREDAEHVFFRNMASVRFYPGN
jgi:hypothetical protein